MSVTPLTVYSEPYARYDTTGRNGGKEVFSVASPLPPSSIDGSTNPNLFSPVITNPVSAVIAYNTSDGNMYVYDGSVWNLATTTVINNSDETVNINGSNVLEFNETALTPYVIIKTPSGVSYSSQPLVAQNLTYYLTPYAPITVYPTAQMKGIGLNIVFVDGSTSVNTRIPIDGSEYVIKLENGGLIFNPSTRFTRIPVGEEMYVNVPIVVADAAGVTISLDLKFVIRQPSLPSRDIVQLNNLIFKLDEQSGGPVSLVTLVKNLAGTDIVASTVSNVVAVNDGVLNGMSFDVTTGSLLGMLADISGAYTLFGITSSSATSPSIGPIAYAVAPYIPLTNGYVPASPTVVAIRAGAISHTDGIGFYFNQEAGGVNYAAVVTLPGYTPNRIPFVTQPGMVIPVRDNAANGVSLMFNRIRGAMAWNPLNNKYYGIAMTGGTVANNLGNAPGPAGTFKLTETTLDYSTYNPTATNPYIGNTQAVYNLTFPAPLPAGPGFAQTAESMFIDSTGMLYVFGVTTGSNSNSYLFSINLLLLPNPPVTIINANSPISPAGDAAASPLAVSALSTPDLTLANGGLPIDLYTERNSYITFDTTAVSQVPIVNGTLAQRVIKPITVNSAAPIARVYFEFNNRNLYGPPLPTLVTTVVPPSFNPVPVSTPIGSKFIWRFEGPASVADTTALIEGMRFQDTTKQDRESTVVVWVDAINGISSIKRTAYIHVI